MNQIRFHLINHDEQLSFEIFVDNQPFVELIRVHEQPLADGEGKLELAGQYMTPPLLSNYDLAKHYLGDPEVIAEDDEKIALLICSFCGDTGCWPLLAQIQVSEDTVVWSDFEQHHRKNWRYDSFGPFVFDRGQYEAALSEIVLPPDSPVRAEWRQRWEESYGVAIPDDLLPPRLALDSA